MSNADAYRQWYADLDEFGRFVANEVQVINSTLARFGIKAYCDPISRPVSGVMIAESSHVSYQLSRVGDQKIDAIIKLETEIVAKVSEYRGKKTDVRISDVPLSIEVPHPQPETLKLSRSVLASVNPHSMAVGRSYSHIEGATDRVLAFDDYPHILVAGTTGAGKSVLLSSMLASLTYATSPEELRIFLVDLKNDDMQPFRNLPHVVTFANTIELAEQSIAAMYEERRKRSEADVVTGPRIVLWIDELAQLAQDKALVGMIGQIAGVGRSQRLNIVGATQYPTKEGGMGSMMSANFYPRLVGRTTKQQAYAATDQKQSGAHQLPVKRGSFLWCEGDDNFRFQSRYVTKAGAERVAQIVTEKWASSQVASVSVDQPSYVAPVAPSSVEQVASIIQPLWEQDATQASMIRAVYGDDANTGGSNRTNVLAAVRWLEENATTTTDDGSDTAENVIKLRRSGSSSSAA